MHRTLSTLLPLALVIAAAPAALAAGGAVGDAAPTFKLTDLAGESRSLADYAGKAVVLEWVNPNCPFSDRHAQERTMTALAAEHGEVVWLGINSTNPEHGDFLSPAEHAEWAEENEIGYPILYDKSGEVGKAYDAKTTPHMFIIDPEGKIVYNGAIDDDPFGKAQPAARTNYVGGGLARLAADGDPDPATTKPYGCSVKY